MATRSKTAAAPLVALLAADVDFHEELDRVFPVYPDAKANFADEQARAAAAHTNAVLQAGYFILAVRAAGLAAGPMGGFDADARQPQFFPDGRHRVFLVVNLGHPSEESYRPRQPRLDYDEVVDDGLSRHPDHDEARTPAEGAGLVASGQPCSRVPAGTVRGSPSSGSRPAPTTVTSASKVQSPSTASPLAAAQRGRPRREPLARTPRSSCSSAAVQVDQRRRVGDPDQVPGRRRPRTRRSAAAAGRWSS